MMGGHPSRTHDPYQVRCTCLDGRRPRQTARRGMQVFHLIWIMKDEAGVPMLSACTAINGRDAILRVDRGSHMPDAKILVVYYSRSGATRKLASSIAARLKADLEEICDYRDRSGPLGYLRSLVEAMRQSCVDIVPHGLDVASYDLIVIGTPVWAGSVSSPVRAYLAENRQQLPHVAFFCSLGGRGSESAFSQMRALAGKAPLAECKVTAREFRRGDEKGLLHDFVGKLRHKLAGIDALEWIY
jgi:flavodoxin